MRVAVVGGGISGLVVCYRLRRTLGPDADITLFERGDRIGGSLRTVEFADGPVDIGAEAFVGRRPEIPALLAELGLSDELVFPAGLRPLIFAGGRLHPMPERTLMGIPTEPEQLHGLVDAATVAKIAAEPDRPWQWRPGSDVEVGALITDRFGAQVATRSVDPLLGGVYAGLSTSIGIRAALPTLAAALDAGAPNLTAAVQIALPAPSNVPVFGGIRGGYRMLVDALVEHAAPAVRSGFSAGPLRRDGETWSLGDGEAYHGVVLATSAQDTARLLAEASVPAAAAARAIPLASSALVMLALAADVSLPANSGILVATGEPLRAKAFTLSSRKWAHLADRDVQLVRASFGRYGDDSPLRWSDRELVAAAATDLQELLEVTVDPVDAVVQRWPGGLPQYLPGHGDRIAAIEAGVATLDRVEVTGSYLGGVGVPACVAAADAAAARLSARL